MAQLFSSEENEISAQKFALIVDDDQSTLEIYDLALADLGFIPVLASDSTKAIESALFYHPAVIILDQLMPGLTGIEVARRLGARSDFQAPIILVSARHDLENEARAAGVSAVLEKPFDVDDLIRAVRDLTEPELARTA